MNFNKKVIGFILAIVAFIAVMLVPIHGLSYPGHAALALLVFAIIMWGTEPVDLPLP